MYITIHKYPYIYLKNIKSIILKFNIEINFLNIKYENNIPLTGRITTDPLAYPL